MEENESQSNYGKLSLMLLISFFIMYWVMYLNVFEWNHIYLNTTRLYMALLMVSPMAVIMLLMMGRMYRNKRMNSMILIASFLVFVVSLTLLRKQVPVGDVQYMKAMIPHHSSAILTSENANIKNPKVKKLADEIIKTQKEEIALMKKLMEEME